MTLSDKIRKLAVVAAVGTLSCWSSVASADLITVEFEVSGFDGGALTGGFTGDDSIGGVTGLLGSYELTHFELVWSGNSTTAAFAHGLGDLTSFLYDIGSNTLMLLSSSSWDGSAFVNPLYATVNGPEPTQCHYYIFCSDPDKQKTWHPDMKTTVEVSEPGTLAVFGLGLLALGFASRRRRS